nr:unnamed protein product [Digitaria exilis]
MKSHETMVPSLYNDHMHKTSIESIVYYLPLYNVYCSIAPRCCYHEGSASQQQLLLLLASCCFGSSTLSLFSFGGHLSCICFGFGAWALSLLTLGSHQHLCPAYLRFLKPQICLESQNFYS